MNDSILLMIGLNFIKKLINKKKNIFFNFFLKHFQFIFIY